MDTLRTRYPPHLDYKKPQKVARACPRPENAIFENHTHTVCVCDHTNTRGEHEDSMADVMRYGSDVVVVCA